MVNKLFALLVGFVLFAVNCNIDEKTVSLEQRDFVRECPDITKKYFESSTFKDGSFLAVVCIDSITDKKGKKIKPKCPPPARITWDMLEPIMSTTSETFQETYKQDALSCIKDSCSDARLGLIRCNYLISPVNEKNFKTLISEYNAKEVFEELFTKTCILETDALREIFLSAYSGWDFINDNSCNPNSPFYKRNTKQFPCVYRVVRVQGNCKCKEVFLL